MAVPALLFAAGSALNFIGQRQADKAQAKAEDLNAQFFLEQAKLSEFETARELDLFQRESESILGSQVNELARSGIAFTGSAVSAIAQGRLSVRKETAAIMKAGELRTDLARMRATQSSDVAKGLKNRGPVQLLSSVLGFAGKLSG